MRELVSKVGISITDKQRRKQSRKKLREGKKGKHKF
jgi:hypothetical protein